MGQRAPGKDSVTIATKPGRRSVADGLRALGLHGTGTGTANVGPVLVLSVLLLAVASPAPVPKPAPTNPFNLDPVPVRSPLPSIGSTRSRPICTAIRTAVAPAVKLAMQNDQTFAGFKTTLYDYTVKETEGAKDLRLMQMDRTVQTMVKNVDELEKAIGSPGLDIPRTASANDADTLLKLRRSLRGIVEAQKVQLDAMSGFVETERMGRFGRQSETESQISHATAPDIGTSPVVPSSQATQPPSTGFLRDSTLVFNKPVGHIALDDARMLDRDLSDLQAYTGKREDAASALIVPAANRCK